MTIKATIYRLDPRYTENGIQGTKLTIDDAYLEIDEIALDRIFEEAQFELIATESKGEKGEPLLPIRDRDDLGFSFLQAYGFFFSVIEVKWNDKQKTELKLFLRFEPHENFTRPLTARYLGGGAFELDREYPTKMPNPFGLRAQNKSPRMLKLVRESDSSRKFLVTRDEDRKSLELNETIQILANWRPDLIQHQKA